MIHAMVVVCSDPQPTIVHGGAQTYHPAPAQSYGATGGETFMGQPVEHAAPPAAAPPAAVPTAAAPPPQKY